MHEYLYLAGNLKFFRHLRRMSQRELAARAASPPITQPAVSRLEHGCRPTRDEDVAALARALDVSEQRLLRRPRVIRSDDPVFVVPRSPRAGSGAAAEAGE